MERDCEGPALSVMAALPCPALRSHALPTMDRVCRWTGGGPKCDSRGKRIISVCLHTYLTMEEGEKERKEEKKRKEKEKEKEKIRLVHVDDGNPTPCPAHCAAMRRRAPCAVALCCAVQCCAVQSCAVAVAVQCRVWSMQCAACRRPEMDGCVEGLNGASEGGREGGREGWMDGWMDGWMEG